MMGDATDALLQFVVQLSFDSLPRAVVERTEDLLLDWLGSVLAGRKARPTKVMEAWAHQMGPSGGRAECLTDGHCTSPLFAAMVNGAASHVVEQDDVHNGAVVHPGATVIPAVLATAQDVGATGHQVILAIVAGYEVVIRVGRFLGPSHYQIFHTTGTAGTLGAAVATGKLLGLGSDAMRDALGTAGTQAAGLWEFLRDAADSKQLHTAKAGADGLLAAYAAAWGLKGAQQILEGPKGLGAGLSRGVNEKALSDGLGERWGVMETSLKWYASCRHTHPAADALDQVMVQDGVSWNLIERVEAQVHQAAIDVLEPARDATTIHQSKFSMPFVLSLIALRGHASIDDFTEENLRNADIRAFMSRVSMVLNPEVEQAYPEHWLGRVRVVTKDGREIVGRVDVPRGDPGNFLSREVIRDKVKRLAMFGFDVLPEWLPSAMAIMEDMASVPRLDTFIGCS